MPAAKKRILLLAGEESGAAYAERLKERLPGCEFLGYQDCGFKTADLAVMGFWAVLKRLFFFIGVGREMKRRIREWRPDVVVTVDYPGLNLKLAAYAKSRGIPAVHIVCPQVWAWRKSRIPKIAASLTRLLCFFPFEPALFKDTALDVRFIGHPLAGLAGSAESAEHSSAVWTAGRENGEGRIALLPGSRIGEIQRILPRLVAAVRILAAGGGRLDVKIPAANARARAEIERIVAENPQPENVALEVTDGGARDILRAADCAAVASGTATLEAALLRCPTVLVYAVSPALAWFARRVIKEIRHIGLANVIAEKTGLVPPMPELLQEAFTPEATAESLRRWLGDPAARAETVRELDAVTARLSGGGDALDAAAREIMECAR